MALTDNTTDPVFEDRCRYCGVPLAFHDYSCQYYIAWRTERPEDHETKPTSDQEEEILSNTLNQKEI